MAGRDMPGLRGGDVVSGDCGDRAYFGTISWSSVGTLPVLACPFRGDLGVSRGGASMLTRLLPLTLAAGAREGGDVIAGRFSGPGGRALPWRDGMADGVVAALTGDIGLEVTGGPGAGAEFPVAGRGPAILELLETVDPDAEAVSPGLGP